MSEFVKQNKLLVHIFAEFSCMCLIVLYASKQNKETCKRIQSLEYKIKQLEDLINKMLPSKQKVTFKQPAVEIIAPETEPESDPEVEADLDEEISKELDRMQLNQS